MSVYRIRQVSKDGRVIVEKRSFWWWDYKDSFSGGNNISRAEEKIKELLAEDAFRPKVISVWSEKKSNGK